MDDESVDAQANAYMCAFRVSMRLIEEHVVSLLAFHDSAELLCTGYYALFFFVWILPAEVFIDACVP